MTHAHGINAMHRNARDLLDTLRTQRRLDLSTIGQLLGKSRSTLGRYADGQAEPDHATLLAMDSLARMDAGAFEQLLRERTQREGGGDLAAFLAEASELTARQVARPRGDDPDRTVSVSDSRRETFKMEQLAGLTRGVALASPLARTMTPTTHPELIPGELSNNVASPSVDNALAMLGAQFLTLPDPWPGKLALVEQDPDGAWIDDDSEDAAGLAETETGMVFAQHTLERHTLRLGPLALSRRLRKQSGALAQVVAGLRRAVVRRLSDAALNGTGGLTAQPLGLLQHGDINRVTANGSAAIPAILQAVGTLEDDEHLMAPRPAILAAPDSKKALMTLDFDGRACWRHDMTSPTGQSCAGLPAAVSPIVPAGELVVADFRWLEVYHAETFDLNATVDAKDRRTLYAFLDADVRLVYPAAFHVIDGIV